MGTACAAKENRSIGGHEIAVWRVLLEGDSLQYPLSKDEHAAMARYLMSIRKQLQDVSDLFTARYGQDSNVAEIAVRALVSSTLLEHELMLLDLDSESAHVTGHNSESLQTDANGWHAKLQSRKEHTQFGAREVETGPVLRAFPKRSVTV